MNPAALLKEVASERPQALAVVFGDRKLTYGELMDRASRLAAAFLSLGLQPDGRVAVLLPNSDDWVVTYFACALSGTVIAPVDLRLQLPEVCAILADLEPHAIVAGSDLPEELAERISLQYANVPKILAPSGREGWLDLQSLIACSKPLDQPVPRGEEDLSAILYTSGTTGRPRGAMLPFRAWDAFQISLEDLYAPPPGRGWLVFAPMSHISGPLYCNATAYFRGTLIIASCMRPSEMLAIVEQHRPYITSVAPPVLTTLLMAAEGRDVDLSCFGLIAVFGAPTPPELRRRFEERFGVKLQTGYGLTEAAPLIALTPPDVGMSRPYCVGKITRTVRVRVVDENGHDVPRGEVGEIIVSGPILMTGYWRQPEETEKVLRGGWLYTGDLGRIDEDGLLYVVGRTKDMIIVGGSNVYAGEVESVLMRHPAVAQVAVLGVSDPLRGEAVKAVVVLRSGETPSAVDLAEFARQYLAPYKVPRVFEFRDSLPLTRTGKVDKAALRQQPLYEEWVT